METIEYELIDFEWGLEYSFEDQKNTQVVRDESEAERSHPKGIEYDANNIPLGITKEEIKLREKIIKDFYARWIENNPTKKVWNDNLKAFIHVKFISINETFSKAARTYESTCAIFKLDEILKTAITISESATKNNRNQKAYEKLILMKALERVKLTVGLQRSTQEYVQYCITSPTDKEKMPTEKR